MNDFQPQRAKSLFDQILDLPSEEHEVFLEKACGSDPLLAEEVRSLVEAHKEAEGFLEGSQVARALHDLASGDGDPLVGAVIGDYRIIELLARGGMGAVYRAAQEHPRREVALKVIDRSVITPELLRRFEVEAQLLARLKHPGIAQIHVAGSTDSEHGNRPYFAMELVDGLTLTRYAEECDLDLPERLELLIRICDAVQHAHHVGVIHRDLKPANILVTPEGQPKILDFGVARSTDADLQVTTLASGQASLIGTLPYMSPEQVRGNPDELDTRSDVHALGILGYELLTGRMPRDLEGKPLTDAIRTIVDEEPRRLGAAGKGRFPADLETIVAKALESDRHRRYDSASAFAADLRRFLDGQPITARPQSAIYQLRKLVVRNRLPAALFIGLVLLAIGSAVLMGFLTRRTAGERDRANLEAVTATEASTFLESLFLQADPELALGKKLTARDILDRGAQRIETELLDQPAVRGRLLTMLGKVYDSLGEKDRATPLLQEAVDIGRALRAEHESDTDRSNLELALCLLARCRAGEGKNDEAVALCREALALSEFVDGPESTQYATCLNHLAYHLSLVGAVEEARDANLRGLALRERLLGPEHMDVGWSVFQYAWFLRTTGDTSGARAQFERAFAIWEKTLPPNHPQIAKCLSGYAQVLTDLGEFDESLALAERALEIQRQALGPDHPEVVNTLTNLGFTLWKSGDLPGAHLRYSEALDTHLRAYGPGDPGVLHRLYTVVFICERMNELDEKEALLQEAVGLVREYHSDSPELASDALGKLGFHYGLTGRDVEAKPLLREAAEHLEVLGESRHQDLVTIQTALIGTLWAEDEVEEALRLNRRTLTIRLEHPEWSGPNPLFSRYRIGVCLLRLGRYEEAEAEFLELLPEVEAAFEVNALFCWNIRWMLGHCCHHLGREDEAQALYDEVIAVDPVPVPEDIYWLLLRKAEAHAAAGRMDEARRELRAALEMNLDPDDGELALVLNPHLTSEQREALLPILRGQ